MCLTAQQSEKTLVIEMTQLSLFCSDAAVVYTSFSPPCCVAKSSFYKAFSRSKIANSKINLEKMVLKRISKHNEIRKTAEPQLILDL